MRRVLLPLAAIVAVCFSSGATAAYIVHSEDIASGAVTHPKLSENSVWHLNIGSSSVQEDNLAFQVKTHFALWFTVYHTGAILQQSGGINEVSGYDYTLPIATGLQNCAVTATGQNPEEIGAAPDPSVPNQLDLTPSDPASDFSVVVFCNGRAAGAAAYGSGSG